MFGLIHIISLFSILLPLATGAVLYKQLDTISRIILLLLVFASLSQLSPLLKNNQLSTPFYNLYILVDVSFWGFIFTVSQKNFYAKLVTLAIWITHISLCMWAFSREGITGRFFHELVCLDGLAQVIWVLIYILSLYHKEMIEGLERQPMFWFCIGALFYSTSSYFLFAFYEQIRVKSTENSYLWGLHDVVNMVMYLLFTAGIVANRARYRPAVKQSVVYD